ncbi:MAG: hypothetical protein GY847_26275 [Proteobacteria bacterium]|nr:hypothetical protein [Pseudomonadota bacterium]
MQNSVFFTVMLGIGILVHGGRIRAEEPDDYTSEGVPEDVDTKLPIAQILLGSFGIVTIAVGAGFGWQAWEERENFNEKEEFSTGGNLVYPLATDELADDIETHALVANILMFGGTAVVIGSILWWILDDKYDKESSKKHGKDSSQAKWHPQVRPGRAGLTIEF